MSFQLMAWAVKQQTGSASRKAVLLCLANAANHMTGRCDPSIRAIAAETELGETAIKTALTALTEQGFIERSRKRNQDGTLGSYRYSFPEAGAAPPEAGDASDPQAGDASLRNQEEDLEPGERSDPSDPLSQESARAIVRRSHGIPTSVDRVPTTEREIELAIGILASWNEQAGQSLRSKDWLAKIIMRIREYPEATLQDHHFIIEQCLRFPWWKGPPTPSVIYGNGAQFERSVMTARQAQGDVDRIERIVSAVIERSRAR